MGHQEKEAIQRGGPRNPYRGPHKSMAEDRLYITIAKPPDAYRIAVATNLRKEQIPEVKQCWHKNSAKGHWVSGPAKMEISLTTVASS